jgi:hypothetical protein
MNPLDNWDEEEMIERQKQTMQTDRTALLKYLLQDRRPGIQLLTQKINLFCLRNVHTDSETQLASYLLDIGALIGG